MDGRTLARVAAVIIVAVAGTAAAIFVARESAPSISIGTPSGSTPPLDSLHATLLHCAELGEAAIHDRDCLAAWAENRRRFLGADEAH